MIDDTTINAFGDELAKIAGMIGNLGKAFNKAVSTGWNKPMGLWEKTRHATGPLRGKPVIDEAGKQVWHARPDATFMGQGKFTKYLPIGDKSINTAIIGAGVPGAVAKEDPEGAGRSRAERMSGLVGGTLGMLAGQGAMAHLPMKRLGITRSIIGGLGGGILGERMATGPFRRARAELPPVEMTPQPAPDGVIA